MTRPGAALSKPLGADALEVCAQKNPKQGCAAAASATPFGSQPAQPYLTWRPAVPQDLPAISAIAAAVHPRHPERDLVFAERLRLFPEGCRVLGRRPIGYLLSHPWVRGAPPALDTVVGGLPERPDALHIHDLALLPEARGRGHAAAAIGDAIARARRLGLPSVSLVAVDDACVFWRSFGFEDDPTVTAGLETYGGEAAAMALDLRCGPDRDQSSASAGGRVE